MAQVTYAEQGDVKDFVATVHALSNLSNEITLAVLAGGIPGHRGLCPGLRVTVWPWASSGRISRLGPWVFPTTLGHSAGPRNRDSPTVIIGCENHPDPGPRPLRILLQERNPIVGPPA